MYLLPPNPLRDGGCGELHGTCAGLDDERFTLVTNALVTYA